MNSPYTGNYTTSKIHSQIIILTIFVINGQYLSHYIQKFSKKPNYNKRNFTPLLDRGLWIQFVFMKLSEICRACCCKLKIDIEIKRLVYDSRKAEEHSIFFAIKGHKTDGNKFVPELLKRYEHICVVSSKRFNDPRCIWVEDVRLCMGKMASVFYNEPTKKLKLVGITGTNGKTTTTYLLNSIFENSEIIGTTGYTLRGERHNLKNTTPESVDLQNIFNTMVKNGVQYCFMEVSSHAITLKRIAGCNFAVKALTNISQDHLDYYKTMENYVNAKLSFFTKSDRKAINRDEAYSISVIDSNTLTYGFDTTADVYPIDYEYSIDGIRLRLSTPIGELSITSSLTGRYNIYNIMCATAIAILLNAEAKMIEEGIKTLKNVPGRLEFFEKNGIYAVVDYAHTDDAMKNVLSCLKDIKKGRLITVFGAGGDRDKGKRPKMGRVAQMLSDFFIITSDNPRSEDPQSIVNDILSGIKDNDNFIVELDRKKAIIKALDLAEPGDIVAVLGKGHEDYQILGDTIIHFDDREVIKEHWHI